MHSTYPLKCFILYNSTYRLFRLAGSSSCFHSQLCETFSEVLFDPKQLEGHGPIPPPQLSRKINSAGWGEELNESTVLENARVFVSVPWSLKV